MSFTIRHTLLNLPTGKTIHGQIVDDAGANVGSAITTASREVGGGVYAWVYSLADGATGFINFYYSDAPGTIIASWPINPAEVELNALADAVLRRSRSHSDGSAETGSLYEIIGVHTQSDTLGDDGTKLTVYKTDGTTVFNQRDLTLDPSALPVQAIG